MNGNGAFAEQQVETIVRRVMEQLSAGRTETGSQETGQPDEVILEETVITGELLEERLNGRRRVRIGAKSVLTPSARDFLHSRNVEWDRAPVKETSAAPPSRWLALIVQSTPEVEAAWEEVTTWGPNSRQRELVGNTAEAVERGVGALCRGDADGVVVFTPAGAVAACRANRNRNVRAAVVDDLQAVQSIRRQMGANFVCIEPEGKSYIEARNLLREVTSGGPPQVPADWHQ